MTNSAEYSLIGSILLNPACLDRVREIVKPEDHGQTGKVQQEWNGATGRLRDDKNCWKSWAS